MQFARTRRRLPKMAKIAKRDEDPVRSRILELIVELGNTVLTKRAAGDLYG